MDFSVEQKLAVLNHGCDGHTVLYRAVSSNRTETVKTILAELRGCTPEQKLKVFVGCGLVNNPLAEAARYGHIEIVKAILAELKDFSVEQKLAIFNNRNSLGRTALMVAALFGHTPVVKAILAELKDFSPEQKLAVVSRQGISGVADWTPLMLAALGNRTETVKVILAELKDYTPEQALAALNYVTTDSKYTALEWAKGDHHTDIVDAIETELKDCMLRQKLSPVPILFSDKVLEIAQEQEDADYENRSILEPKEYCSIM